MTDDYLPTRSPGEVALEVRDRRGSLLQHYRAPMRSYLANYQRLISGMMLNKAIYVWRHDVEGTIAANYTAYFLTIRAKPGHDKVGIIIGTSPRAVQGTDRKLGTRYAQGSQTNQFMYQYGTSLDSTPTFPGGGTVQMRHQRTFVNQSAGALTVNEVGVAGSYIPAGGPVLWIRDKVGPVSVPSLATLTVTYTFYRLN